jgi:hypothetical protein
MYHGAKRHELKADQTSTSAEVRKMWIYTSTPPYFFMDDFTFTLHVGDVSSANRQ